MKSVIKRAMEKVTDENRQRVSNQAKALNLHDVVGQIELLKAYESTLLNAGDLTQEIKDQDRNDFIEAFNCA